MVYGSNEEWPGQSDERAEAAERRADHEADTAPRYEAPQSQRQMEIEALQTALLLLEPALIFSAEHRENGRAYAARVLKSMKAGEQLGVDNLRKACEATLLFHRLGGLVTREQVERWRALTSDAEFSARGLHDFVAKIMKGVDHG